MSISRNNEKISMNPHIYEQINLQLDKRLKMIYDRYHSGRSIIIDDLKYLLLKDPEGYDKLARSIVASKTDKGIVINSNNMLNMGYMMINTESTSEYENYLDYKISTDSPTSTLKNVPDIMTSVKSILEKMSEMELMDISKNLYEASELIKLTQKMKNWDDAFKDKMLMYTYDVEKEFDIVV